jgi:hypothetical protein
VSDGKRAAAHGFLPAASRHAAAAAGAGAEEEEEAGAPGITSQASVGQQQQGGAEDEGGARWRRAVARAVRGWCEVARGGQVDPPPSTLHPQPYILDPEP